MEQDDVTHLTLIVRCDQGGLANQTRELYSRLMPDSTIVVHLESPRGRERDDWYADAVHVRHENVTPNLLAALTPPGGSILTCETFYCDVAPLRDRRRVLVANAELFDSRDAVYDTLVIPTTWERHRMPKAAQHLPHPQAEAPRTHFRRRDEGTSRLRFLHPAAPAMLDRNGTNTVLEAARLTRIPSTIIVRAPGQRPARGLSRRVGNAQIEWDDSAVDEWWENYPVDCDAMVLPRRYGGLCLPAQEAAACGMPTIMPALSPQLDWPGPRFHPGNSQAARMKGGMFRVYYPSPAIVAAAMDDAHNTLAADSGAAIAWADSLHWDTVGDAWRKLLCR